MSWSISSERKSAFKKSIFIGTGAILLFWVLFFDSHSVYSRFQMSREHARLESDNGALREKIAVLEKKLARPLTNDEVEKIAREEFGMSRPGEQVYPVVVK